MVFLIMMSGLNQNIIKNIIYLGLIKRIDFLDERKKK